MARDIRTLTSSELHEPKRFSDSTSADAGKVLTPLSGGDSELRNLTPEEVGIRQYFLEWEVLEGTTPLSLSAASDSDLYTASDYTALNSANVPGATTDNSNGMSFDTTDYTVELPVDGVYRLDFWVNLFSDVNNTLIGFRATADGTVFGATLKHDLPNGDRTANISASALTQGTAGTKVGLAIAADKNADVTIQDIKASLLLVKED